MIDILTKAQHFQLQFLRDTIIKLENFEYTSNMEVISFSLPNILNDDNLNGLAEDIPKSGKFIYFFKTIDHHNIPTLFKNFSNKKDIKFSRLNKLESSEILYVGSSNSLKKRFKEHCGLVSKGTYAIKFREWLADDNIEIEFCYFQLDGADQDILQNIEDGLWKTMMPTFGKFGGKY